MAPKASSSQKGKEKDAKPVARAACLSCRIAKRRCDGIQPHCGPCKSRGFPLPPPDMPQEERAVKPNSTQYCVFVASRRGGPRYKGVVGAENELVKMEREAEKARKQQQQQQASGGSSSGNETTNGNPSKSQKGKGNGNGNRGIKRERTESIDQSWSNAADGRQRSSSSISNGQSQGEPSAAYQHQGNFQDHRSPNFSETSLSNVPASKKSKHLEAEEERSREQARARTAALNAQQSFQQSRMQSQRGSGGAFPNLNHNANPNFTFQSIPPGARSSISVSSPGTASGTSERSPVDLLEAAEIARTETMKIASSRPDMFDSSRVRHGTQSFMNSHTLPDPSQFQSQSQHSMMQQQHESDQHRNFHHQQQQQHHQHRKSQTSSDSRSNPHQPPLLSLSSLDQQPQFNGHSYNNSSSQFNSHPQSSSSSHLNFLTGPTGNHSQSNSNGHSNHGFHPFAMPSPLNTPQPPSNSASNQSNTMLAPMRSNVNETSLPQFHANHNFPQSSSRDALASTSSLSSGPHIDGSQNRLSSQQFNGSNGGGDSAAHALSSANLDLWQRLQRESDNEGYGQDTFAQLYSFGDGSNPNMFPTENFQKDQSTSHHQQQQQQAFEQRELFSLDLNMPVEMNLGMTSNILGDDFDLTMDMFNSFYNKLENLPKAGVHQNAEALEEEKRPSRKERSRKAGDKNGSRSGTVDEENRARTVLSVFFENVYPTCPVLLPSSSLSSLAFYFTEKSMPCALWASISACAALHMGDEAFMTLRKGGGRNPAKILKKKNTTLGEAAACLGDDESDFSEEEREDATETGDQQRPQISAVDIAAHHARTAEWLIQRYTDLIAEETGFKSSKNKGGATKGEDVDMNSSSTMPSLSPSSASTFSHGTAETPKVPPQQTEPAKPASSAASQNAEGTICSMLPDMGLVAIESTAAKTLLAHYYYGGASGEGDSRKRAWEMAKEAWKGAADLELWDEGWEKEKEADRKRAESREASNTLIASTLNSNSMSSSPSLAELIHSMKQERENDTANFNSNLPPSHVPSAGSPFSNSQRIEWARRIYWCAYEAATVMTATGGYDFKAVDFALNCETEESLQLRPGVGSLSRQQLEKATDLLRPPTDRGWATMIRGAQLVSRAYRSLYQLDELNHEMATRSKDQSSSSQKDLSAKRSRIFEEMLALDEDIGGFLVDDSSKKASDSKRASSIVDSSAPGAGSGAEFPPEEELHRALSVSGTLMATGATIILHRAQAYGRARLFMQPNCCVPRQSENNDTGFQYKDSPYGSEARRPSTMSRQSLDDSQGRRVSDQSNSASRVSGGSLGSSRVPNGKEQNQNGLQEEDDEEEEVVPASAPIPSSLRPGEGMSSKLPGMLSIPTNSRPALVSARSISNGVDGNPQLPDTFFAGGPFLPSHSFNRCRSAAETMAHALKPILNELLKNIEVDEMLALRENSEEADKTKYALQSNSSPRASDLSLLAGIDGSAEASTDAQQTFTRSRESSTNRSQQALAMLNSADDSKRRAIIKKAPKLPPFSACSCVLGAYVLLMQSLAVRINSGAATPALDTGSPAASSPSLHQATPLVPHTASLKALANSASARHPSQAGLAGGLINQFRNTANDFSRILDFFSTVWPIASDYKDELSALLAANESLN